MPQGFPKIQNAYFDTNFHTWIRLGAFVLLPLSMFLIKHLNI